MCVIWFVLSVLMGAVLVHSSKNCPSKEKDFAVFIGSGSNWYLRDNQTLIICCRGLPLQSSMLDNTLINTSPHEVQLESCRAPAVSIAAVLQENNVTLPRRLRITDDILDDTFLQLRIFSELDNLLDLTLSQTNFFQTIRVPTDLIETFNSLQTLHLTSVKVPLNFNTSVSELILEKMYVDQKINCRNLRVLTLRSVYFNEDFQMNNAEPWLINCTALEDVTIESVQQDDMIYILLNKIYFGSQHNFNKPAQSRTENKTYPFPLLPRSLKKLSLAFNSMSSFCYEYTLNVSGNVETLEKRKSTEKFCITTVHSTVNFLNMSHNVFTKVEFQDILKIRSQNLVIDFRGNPLHFIHLEEEEYNELHKRMNKEGTNITLLLDSLINCECHHGWLARAVQDFPSFVVTASCKDEVKTRLNLAPKERLECTMSSCYPGCSCRRQWRDNVTTLWCKGLTSMPVVPNMHALLARSNEIAELHSENLPDSLKILDLSNNKIKQMDATVATKLFSVPKRRVWLAGNPLLCLCDLVKELKDHKRQVWDYDKIVCYNQTGLLQPLAEISVDILCTGLLQKDNNSTLSLVLSVTFALLTILAFFIALFCRYKSSIQQYFYLRGCCLFCVTEEENGSEMLYDVFLSYSHKDEEFVLQELLPGLEEEQAHPYKVCIHFRDWILGEFIPKQIVRSVEQSRRTLIVLSINFVQSFWGLLEFRSALISDVYENSSRIIVVVLDEVVNDPDLDPELRNYVRTNTYVRWGDPQFWKKLRYALPHRTKIAKESKSIRDRRRFNNESNNILLSNSIELIHSDLVYPNDYRD